LFTNNWIHIFEALTACLVFLTIYRVIKQTSQSQKVLDSAPIDDQKITVIETENYDKDNAISYVENINPQTKKQSKEHNTALNDYIGDFFSS